MLKIKIEVHVKKVIKTNPNSGYIHRNRKPVEFYHLIHGTANNILLSIHVTAENVGHSTVYIDNLENMFEKLNLVPKYVNTDAGYFNPNILCELYMTIIVVHMQ